MGSRAGLIRVATVVQHHPARAHLLPALLERLAGLEPLVVTDPEPDGQLRSAWRTYRACLQAMPAGASHLLIVQDDAVPCLDFAAGVRAAVAARPAAPVVFWVGGAPRATALAVQRAADRCEAWAPVALRDWLPLVATCWPGPLAGRFVAWAAGEKVRPRHRTDDDLAGRFMRAEGFEAWATVPSLVEHGDEQPSLIGRPGGRASPARRASCWIGDWSATLVDFGG